MGSEAGEMNQQRRPAGAAFLRAVEADPVARAAWERARSSLQAIAQVVDAGAQVLGAGMAAIKAEREKALLELTEAVRDGLRQTDRQLEAAGFAMPRTIEDWEHLARIVEMPLETIRSGDFTLADVHALALAWVDRQRMKAKLAAEASRGLLPSSPAVGQPDTAEEIQTPPLTSNEAAVLRTLAGFDPSELVSTARIEAAMEPGERLSERSIGLVVRRLMAERLAERPEGDRKGARLTIRGRQLARKIAD